MNSNEHRDYKRQNQLRYIFMFQGIYVHDINISIDKNHKSYIDSVEMSFFTILCINSIYYDIKNSNYIELSVNHSINWLLEKLDKK